jgi:four helix bundle protein
MYKSFIEMPVWKKAHELSVEVFHLTINLPRSEDYGLTSQIRKSSNSVPGNISEGFGRKTKRDKAHFYTIARGSAFETQNHLLYGNSVGYFADETTKRLFNEYSALIFDLNKLINSLT